MLRIVVKRNMSNKRPASSSILRFFSKKSKTSSLDDDDSSSTTASQKIDLECAKQVVAESEYSCLENLITDPEWRDALGAVFEKPYWRSLKQFLSAEQRSGQKIFPPPQDIFNALNSCALSQVKVVVLGQDPYHNDGQAHGLAFSVRPPVVPPPSLKNIFKELSSDLSDIRVPDHGNLQYWADQGVLLLNTLLTVRAHSPMSHAKKGWEKFTDEVISAVNKRNSGCVFLLWGKPAQTKGKHVDLSKHKVLKCPHPSPLSAHRGFFGCAHFSKCNLLLESMGKAEIDWQLP